MKRRSRLELVSGVTEADPDSWPDADTEALSRTDLKRFHDRRRAVSFYLQSTITIREITEKTGISKTEVKRLVDRCFETASNGSLWGWAALLPHVRIKDYNVTKFTGTAGRWKHFLDVHPKIAKKLNAWALARTPADGTKPRGKMFAEIWIAFERLCDQSGIDTQTDYPFSNKDRGRECIRRHCRVIRKVNFVAGALAEHGGKGIRPGMYENDYWEKSPPPEGPYHRVQLDGHRMDVDLVVIVEDADGKLHKLPLSRLWLLVLIDTASRAVLGYHISLEENYTADDVLECVANSLNPWTPRQLPNDRLSYVEGAGLPNGTIDKCAWRAFSMIQMDNAWAHTSQWVQERIIETVGCEIVTNRPRSPRSDAIVERFMLTFERSSLHRWPSTTGSHPKDPRRTDSEKQAKKLEAEFEDLQDAADLAIANYNAGPHLGLNGLSPLEFLQQRLDRGYDLVRRVKVRDPARLPLFQKSFTATVRGSQKLVHFPYVQFMGVRYSNEAMSESAEIIGEKVTFRVNIKDIRTAEVFHKGRSLGRLYAAARWMRHPHSLRMRRAIMKLAKRRKIDWASNNPVGAHLEYLNKNKSLNRRARNKLLQARRVTHTDNSEASSTTANQRSRNWSMSDPIRIDSTHVTR